MNRTSSFVLDCSATVAWCFEDEATDYTDAVLTSLRTRYALVPSLWQLEISNVLLMAERRQRIQEKDIIQFVNLIGQLPIKIEANTFNSLSDLIMLSRLYKLTSYDANYLYLAMLYNIPLATLDRALQNAAEKANVKLYVP